MMERIEGPYVIRHGDVWYGDPADGVHVCDGTGELAIAYDVDDGTLHKHGPAERVRAWAEKTTKQLSEFGMTELAQALRVVSFPVSQATVDELNACAAITGHVMKLVERLEAVGEADPSLASRPRYPD